MEDREFSRYVFLIVLVVAVFGLLFSSDNITGNLIKKPIKLSISKKVLAAQPKVQIALPNCINIPATCSIRGVICPTRKRISRINCPAGQICQNGVCGVIPADIINAYSDLLSNPRIKNALIYKKATNEATLVFQKTYDEWDEELKNYFFDALRELEQNGRLSEVDISPAFTQPLNENHPVNKQIYAKRVALSLWVEKHNLVPWSLLEYNDNQLSAILSSSVNEIYAFTFDSDPYWDYTFMTQEQFIPFTGQTTPILKENQLATVTTLLDRLRKPSLVHYTVDIHAPEEIWGQNAFFQRIPNIYVVSNKNTINSGVSGSGCKSTSSLIADLLRVTNIPALREDHIVSTDCSPHAGLSFPSINRILIHGDDPYTKTLGAAASSELLVTKEIWNEIKPIRPAGEITPEICQNIAIPLRTWYILKEISCISVPYLRADIAFCHDEIYHAGGVNVFLRSKSDYSQYITQEQWDKYVADLREISASGACTNPMFDEYHPICWSRDLINQ